MNNNLSIISINGTIVPAEKASISVFDRGLLYGDQIFEVIAGFGSNLLDLQEHLNRLQRSAAILGMELPWKNEELVFELQELIKIHSWPKSFVRIVITRGSTPGLCPAENTEYTKIVYLSPQTITDKNISENGATLKLKKLGYTYREEVAKTNDYKRSIQFLANSAHKNQDILWFNSSQEITECSAANIFFIGRHGDYLEIVTPSHQCGLLRGVTRARILTLLKNANILAEEQIIFRDEIAKYDEAFMTSSVKGLIPIEKIDDKRFQTTRPTSTFFHIKRLYDAWVTSQIGYEIDWQTGKKK